MKVKPLFHVNESANFPTSGANSGT